jgi:hypothetical protein
MVVSTRKRVPPDLIDRVRERAQLPPETHYELLTVHPVKGARGFDSVHCVQPSVAPWRPLVGTAGEHTPLSGGRRVYAKALAAGRALVQRLPLPAAARRSSTSYLATACATSRDLHRRVREMDVVAASDAEACYGLWVLARHVPEVPVVHRVASIRKVLEGLGIDVPQVAPRNIMKRGDVIMPTELRLPHRPEASRRLLIAPANYAGQAHAWAAAVEKYVPDATAMNFRAGTLKNPFPADYYVEGLNFAGDLDWRIAWRDFVTATFTHVVVEANRPIFGSIASRGEQSVRELLHEGKKVAVLSHGTDGRIPSVHAARERWHPYDALDEAQLDRMEESARANVAFYNSFDGPVYVSTPGLLEFVERGTWLPLVVDVDLWTSTTVPMEREVPIVAHIPSGPQKGSHMIDPVLTSLAERGLIEYRRIEGVQYHEMPGLYGTADIMVEQFGIADYSAAACEAMSSGRVVVSRVADAVRERVRKDTGLELPVVEANPDTLEDVILGLVADRERARTVGAQGAEFVRTVHDGRRSAQILQQWLDESTDTSGQVNTTSTQPEQVNQS